MFDFACGMLVLVSLKAIIVGSDFNFYAWYKYGQRYTKWYFSRPFYEDYSKVDIVSNSIERDE